MERFRKLDMKSWVFDTCFADCKRHKLTVGWKTKHLAFRGFSGQVGVLRGLRVRQLLSAGNASLTSCQGHFMAICTHCKISSARTWFVFYFQSLLDFTIWIAPIMRALSAVRASFPNSKQQGPHQWHKNCSLLAERLELRILSARASQVDSTHHQRPNDLQFAACIICCAPNIII
jgi:hypothetical protein